jgi:hypothetical protein
MRLHAGSRQLNDPAPSLALFWHQNFTLWGLQTIKFVFIYSPWSSRCAPFRLAAASLAPLALAPPTAPCAAAAGAAVPSRRCSCRSVSMPLTDTLQNCVVEAYSSARSSLKTSPLTLFPAIRRVASALAQGIVNHAAPQALVARPSLQQVDNHIRTKTGHVTLSMLSKYRKRYLWTPNMRLTSSAQK